MDAVTRGADEVDGEEDEVVVDVVVRVGFDVAGLAEEEEEEEGEGEEEEEEEEEVVEGDGEVPVVYVTRERLPLASLTLDKTSEEEMALNSPADISMLMGATNWTTKFLYGPIFA